mmetsp:Transcript_21006/g.27237  ORF Transcript_21006/g.27237 Transcript_21006/m.27237 type:complete len:238 (+) Transcript_21006:111-824(+)|eukprot:CAMPEP_0197287904 /NCGR_PEP_ID=MMETSP0890-20130614/4739_1 /TAXON_ID=44058 ORGANISM="Aureoumbra lagunensis, Strain CCMP1510" /NCGR_SAMPLE_ID=MMETSP0890 /ASSEMBLY_ACC=CAM_ASM_000533 /LENGTH=237 /DNA_ID=CAMNT_0042758149 /DNA_START=110 /DNA_END=823 /DNA_ORIENTATION=+
MATGPLQAKAVSLAARVREEKTSGPRQGEEDSRFRGSWQLASKTPTFNAFQFLPTPPPQKPRLKLPSAIEECEEVEKQVIIFQPPEELILLHEPPANIDTLFIIKDRYSNYRGYISKDGECRNNRNQLLGFINESDQCGSAEQEYLGSISPVNEFNDSICIITDAIDDKCALLDLGNGYIKNFDDDRIVAEISHNGICSGHAESYLGQFEGFSFHYMKTIALYLILLDPGMLNEVEG